MAQDNLILIRFNTDHPKDPDNELPWRIICGGCEFQASGFEINTPCFDQSGVMPDVGYKWHVATRGSLSFEGTKAFIK